MRTSRHLCGRMLSPMAEVDSAGNVVTRFVYGVAGHVPDYMLREDRTFRLVIDHLGSVRRVVDTASGEVVQEIDYDAFGRVLRDSNPGFQPFGYAGGLVDAHTGFVRFGARDYDPQAGRWTAKDPSGFGGGTANFYEYAANNPTNLVDPNGQFAFIPILMAAWGIAEIGMSVADFISFLETLALVQLTIRLGRNPAFVHVSRQVDVRSLLSGPNLTCYVEGQQEDGLGYCWTLEVAWTAEVWEVTSSFLRDGAHGQDEIWSHPRKVDNAEQLISALHDAVTELVVSGDEFDRAEGETPGERPGHPPVR